MYANTLSYGAAWDDTRFVFESGARDGIAAAGDLLARPFLLDVPPSRSPYRPLTAVSYALDWSVGGGQAAFFHGTNVALHGLVTALVGMLLLALGTGRPGAAAGGALFAVHPVHVEAVANLAGRAELLAAACALFAAWLYLGAARARDAGRRSPARAVAVAVLFAAALAAKENAVVLPALLVALEAARPAPTPLAHRLLRGAPLWIGLGAVGAAYMAVRASVLGTFTTVDVAPFMVVLPTAERVTTAVANWGEYARLLFFPLDLVVDYGPAVILPAGPGDVRFWAGLLVGVAAVAAAGAAARAGERRLALAVAWFAVAVFPVSNLVVPIAQWLAERFLYLPSVGLSIAVAAGAAHLAERPPALPKLRAVAGAFMLVLVLFAGRSWTRSATWRDTDTVATTLVREHPESFRGQWLLGTSLLQAGRAGEGLAALERAIAISPNAIELHLERAGWLERLGRPEEALRAVEALPALRHPDRGLVLARALRATGRPDEAREALLAALARFPGNAALRALADSLGVEAPRP